MKRPPLTAEAALVQAMVGIAALLLLTLGLELFVVGAVRHDRAQHLAYSALRSQLAHGETPVGPIGPDGSIVKLGAPVALLQIPSIGLDDVVFEGTTSEVLADGPGHLRTSPMPGQPGTAVLYGRLAAYGGDFWSLGSLHPGASITVTTGQGVQHFKVTRLRHAGDKVTGIDPLAAGLTLVSAEGSPLMPSGVLRVDASLVGTPQPEPAQISPASLSRAENVMAGDSTGLVALLLWSQLLLITLVGLVWLRSAWGRWQTWIVAVPLLGLGGLQVAHQLAMLLPNLL